MKKAEVERIVKKAMRSSVQKGITVVTMPWTSEEWLGSMRREGVITHFKQVDGFEEGNLRRYRISYDEPDTKQLVLF